MPRRQPHVLVVMRDEPPRTALVERLASAGYAPHAVAETAAARAAFQPAATALVLLDLSQSAADA